MMYFAFLFLCVVVSRFFFEYGLGNISVVIRTILMQYCSNTKLHKLFNNTCIPKSSDAFYSHFFTNNKYVYIKLLAN